MAVPHLATRLARSAAIAFACLVVHSTVAHGQESRPTRPAIVEIAATGAFREAEVKGQAWLDAVGAHAPAGMRKSVEDDLDVVRRIRGDYKLTRDDLLAQLKDAVRDFSAEEFDRFDREGRFDARMIDGQRRYANSSRSNLFFRYPELAARRVHPAPDTLKGRILAHIDAVAQEAERTGRREVLPATYEVSMTIRVDPSATPEGKTVRCWMPFPRALPHQEPGVVMKTAPMFYGVEPVDAPMRALYMERPAVEDEETTFSATYRYTARAVAPFAGKDRTVAPISDAERARFLAEAPPHVVFSSPIRALSEELAKGTADKRALARRIYDWIGDEVKYSFAREYSTIPCIPEKVVACRYGDCGEAALLFITLCRMNGIPARWQSGWAPWPGNETMHDWAEMWIDGQGWCPVDPYMAVYAATLDDASRRKVRDFYFGGLDHFRLIANSDHGVPLNPPKPSLRSDTVDFQRGEVECDGKNVYFDRFHWSMKITPIEP